jgi:large subunit ribosomal protein L1
MGEQKIKVKQPDPIPAQQQDNKQEEKEQVQREPKVRGKKYKKAQKKVDREKRYPIKEAVKLAQETSLSSFTGNLEAHLIMTKQGDFGEVDLPYFKGKEKKIVIMDEKVLKKIEQGKTDFDVLLAEPKWMSKLGKYGKILGPKGLMPNPKDGTLVNNPQKAKKKMEEKETIKLKTERKQAVMHLVLGKLDQPTKELVANVNSLVEKLGPKKIKKLVLTATMGPGIKVEIKSQE